ncbi:protein phosphatase 2C domain-containing protein [Gordonia alkaliphila]|uniref:PPM-type phosphatase domain-containing protein n=1 Tax=Gordonia alkaliphila TaxID=1053547 RepID=A0ABP8ZK77_9ACTN
MTPHSFDPDADLDPFAAIPLSHEAPALPVAPESADPASAPTPAPVDPPATALHPEPGVHPVESERKWIHLDPADGHVLTEISTGHYSGRPHVASDPHLDGLDHVRPTAIGSIRGGVPSDAAANSGYVNHSVAVGAVSLRGISHYRELRPAVRQDAYSVGHTADWVIVAVGDGVSQGPLSHLAAERAVSEAFLIMRDFLAASGGVPPTTQQWIDICEECRSTVEKFARQVLAPPGSSQAAQEADLTAVARKMSTTLDIALVATAPDSTGRYPFVHASMAGDGSSFLLDRDRGWAAVRDGKPSKAHAPADFAVVPLPQEPEHPPTISRGTLRPGQAFVLVTDGFGDMLSGGATMPAYYLHRELSAGPIDVAQLIRVASLMNPVGDDDRTAVVVWTVP